MLKDYKTEAERKEAKKPQNEKHLVQKKLSLLHISKKSSKFAADL